MERNCRFPVLRVLATRNVEEAAPGIASSAVHNPAVMAFDSCDCSDNYTGDRAVYCEKFELLKTTAMSGEICVKIYRVFAAWKHSDMSALINEKSDIYLIFKHFRFVIETNN